MTDERIRRLERQAVGPGPELVALAREWQRAGRHVPGEIVRHVEGLAFTALRGTLLALVVEGPPERAGALVEGPPGGPERLWCDGGAECRCPPDDHEERPPLRFVWVDGQDEPAVWREGVEVHWPRAEHDRVVGRAAELLGEDLGAGRRVRSRREVEASRARRRRRHEAGACAPSCGWCRRGRP